MKIIKKIITEYLKDENKIENVKEFLNEFNDALLEIKSFTKVEKALQHPLFTLVNAEFKQSDILIKACQKGNKKLAKWLFTMYLNPHLTDSNGRTALMYAVQQMLFDSVIKQLIKVGNDYVNTEDNDGNTALFHAVGNFAYVEKLIEAGSDYKHTNKNGDTLIIYACKREKFVDFKKFLDLKIDIAHVNNEGKNLAMTLVEKSRSKLLSKILDENEDLINYRNKLGETLVSTYIKNYYQKVISNETPSRVYIGDCAKTFRVLVSKRCNFNISIDEYGNTPAHFFMYIEDYHSLLYLIYHIRGIDISIRNNDGMNVSFLSFFVNTPLVYDYTFVEKEALEDTYVSIQYKNIIEALFNHDSFDYSYLDIYNNNMLIHNIVRNTEPFRFEKITKKSNNLDHCNDKGENAFIIAVKLGNKIDVLTTILKQSNIDINHFDQSGNTALHYAVKMKDKNNISFLLNNNANPQIKMNDGMTAIDLAKSIDDPDIIDLLENPQKEKGILEKIKDNVKYVDGFTKEDKLINERYLKLHKNEYKHLIEYEIPNYAYIPSPKNKDIRSLFFRGLYEESINKIEAEVQMNRMYRNKKIFSEY